MKLSETITVYTDLSLLQIPIFIKFHIIEQLIMLLCIIYSLIVLVVILTLQLVSLITEIMSYTTHVALTVPAKLLNKEYILK